MPGPSVEYRCGVENGCFWRAKMGRNGSLCEYCVQPQEKPRLCWGQSDSYAQGDKGDEHKHSSRMKSSRCVMSHITVVLAR